MNISRLLAGNLISNLLLQVVNLGFPLAIQFYLVRTLSLSDLSNWYLVAAAFAIYQLILSFSHLNLVRKTAKTKYVEYYLGAFFTISNMLLFLALPLFFSYLYFLASVSLELLAVSAIMFLTLPFSFEFYFQGKLLNKLILYRRIISKILYLLSILIFVKTEDDFLLFFALSVIFISFEHLWNLINLLKRQKIKFDFRLTKVVFLSSLKYIPFNMAYNTLPNISLLIISNFVSQEVTAYYAIFLRIVNVFTTFITSSVIVLMPYRLAHGIDAKSEKMIFVAKLGMASLVIVVANVFAVYILQFFTAQMILGDLLMEFRILLFYIIIHVIYNYLVFKWYVSVSRIAIPILLSSLQVICFLTSFYILSIYFEFTTFSNLFVLSSLLMLVMLLIIRKYYRRPNGSLRI